MEIRKRVSEGTIQVLELQGRLDAHQGPQVDKALEGAVGDVNRTILNLRKVHFIDSTGLAVLVKGMKHHRERQGDLVLCELQQPVQIIFELTRLEKMFAIYSTEAEALQSFN